MKNTKSFRGKQKKYIKQKEDQVDKLLSSSALGEGTNCSLWTLISFTFYLSQES